MFLNGHHLHLSSTAPIKFFWQTLFVEKISFLYCPCIISGIVYEGHFEIVSKIVSFLFINIAIRFQPYNLSMTYTYMSCLVLINSPLLNFFSTHSFICSYADHFICHCRVSQSLFEVQST